MKRKSVGALALPKRRRHKKITTYIDSSDEESDSGVDDVDFDKGKPGMGEWVFNMSHLLIEHLLPFFEDEYDLYQFKQVNKTCNEVVNHKTPTDPKLSLLSNWFARQKICCICRSPCTNNSGEHLGMYCHKLCVPTLNLYYTDGIILRSEMYPIPGRPCAYLYDTPSPCVKDISKTCRGFNLNKSYITYKALDKDKVDEQLKKIDTFIKFIRKSERIDRLVDKKTTVRVGVNPINVYQYFCRIHPNHINTMSEDEIVEKMALIKMGLTQAHSEMNKFYRDMIRPHLYVSRAPEVKNWPAYLRNMVQQLRNYNLTITDFLLKHNIHESPKSVQKLMTENLVRINNETIVRALAKTGSHYYQTLRAVIPMLSNSCFVVRDFRKFVGLAESIVQTYREVFHMYDTKEVFPHLYTVMRVSIDAAAKQMLIIYDKNRTKGPVFIRNAVNQIF